jgi:AcrR family transcriptional regulator
MLEAAVKLVAERGLEAVALTDVGLAAGYSRGLAGYHFASKEVLDRKLVAFIKDAFAREVEVYRRQPGLETLKEIIASAFSKSLDDPVYLCVMRIVLAERTPRSKIWADVVELRKTTLKTFEAQIREGIRKGEIRSGVDVKTLGLVIMSAVGGIFDRWSINPAIDMRAAGRELTSILLHGIAA